MTGLRMVGAALIWLGATVAVFSAVIAIDRIYVHGSLNHGRLITWLIGGGLYAIIIGILCLVVDTGDWHRYVERHVNRERS